MPSGRMDVLIRSANTVQLSWAQLSVPVAAVASVPVNDGVTAVNAAVAVN